MGTVTSKVVTFWYESKGKAYSSVLYKTISAAVYGIDANLIDSRPPSVQLKSLPRAAHNLLMIGPSGSGKTMQAKRMPTILPPLTCEEALETTKIHCVAGVLDAASGLVGTGRSARPITHR